MPFSQSLFVGEPVLVRGVIREGLYTYRSTASLSGNKKLLKAMPSDCKNRLPLSGNYCHLDINKGLISGRYG